MLFLSGLSGLSDSLFCFDGPGLLAEPAIPPALQSAPTPGYSCPGEQLHSWCFLRRTSTAGSGSALFKYHCGFGDYIVFGGGKKKAISSYKTGGSPLPLISVLG